MRGMHRLYRRQRFSRTNHVLVRHSDQSVHSPNQAISKGRSSLQYSQHLKSIGVEHVASEWGSKLITSALDCRRSHDVDVEDAVGCELHELEYSVWKCQAWGVYHVISALRHVTLQHIQRSASNQASEDLNPPSEDKSLIVP